MDQKQFERLQSAVQWAVDEDRLDYTDDAPRALQWRQATWGEGRVIDERVEATGGMAQGTVSLVCTTACCLAGNVVTAHGDKMVVELGEEYVGGEMSVNLCIDDEGIVNTISERAQGLLGITESQASHLFDGDNDVDLLVQRAERVADRYGFELEII